MNTARLATLLASLDEAVAILDEQRTPDALCVAAFDTLKQARALVLRAFDSASEGPTLGRAAPRSALLPVSSR